MTRPEFIAGNYLFAEDLLTEQYYRQQRLRRHNRFLHDWGVVCGLQVVPGQDLSRPWAVLVCPGYAIACCGDEIEVLAPAVLDIREHLWSRGQGRAAYIGIRYAEVEVRPIPVPSPECGCQDTTCAPSRIQDAYQLDVLWQDPDTEQANAPDLCERPIVPCPDCTNHTHVILACVILPASEGDPLTFAHIHDLRC